MPSPPRLAKERFDRRLGIGRQAGEQLLCVQAGQLDQLPGRCDGSLRRLALQSLRFERLGDVGEALLCLL